MDQRTDPESEYTMIEIFHIPNDWERDFWSIWRGQAVKVRVIGIAQDKVTDTPMFRVQSETGQDFAVGREDLFESKQEATVAICQRVTS